MGERWVKLYEKIRESSIYHDSELVHLWVHLLIKASKFGNNFMWNGVEITLNPGQLITGRKKLSDQTGISESKIQRALKKFEKCHMIEQQTASRNRLITILNWQRYQESEQVTNNKRTGNEQVTNTIKKDRKIESKNTTELFEKAFEKWWLTYPKRAGRRIGKKEAKKKFLSLKKDQWNDLNTATINYKSSLSISGLSPSDAHRFLNETWKEYIKKADSSGSQQDDGSEAAQKRIEETRRMIDGK